MSNIQIPRQLFADIFNYFYRHEKELPDDPKLAVIKRGLVDKYLKDSDRQQYTKRLQEQGKSVKTLADLDEML